MAPEQRGVEDVELAAFTDFSEAAARLQPLALRHEIVDQALIMTAPGDHHFLINRLIGLGVDAPATPSAKSSPPDSIWARRPCRLWRD